MGKLTVRNWIIKFNNGELDFEKAGWRDWLCDFEELDDRTELLSKTITKIDNDFILDNYSIILYNKQGNVLFDTISFNPITDDADKKKKISFDLTIGDCRNLGTYAVSTGRKDGQVEYVHDLRNEAVKYINKFGEEFKKI